MKTSPEIVTALSSGLKEPAWALELRLKALQNYEALPWPGARDERWKRSQLEAISWDTLESSPLEENGDGWISLAEAIKKSPDLVQKAWTTAVEDAKTNKFLSLTLAMASGGSCLFIPKNSQTSHKFRSTVTNGIGRAHFALRFVFADEGADSQLWEELDGGPSNGAAQKKNGLALVSTFTSINLADNARTSLYHLQNWNARTAHFQFQNVSQGAHSKFNAVEVAVGGRIFRNETTLNLNGRGAENKMLGVLFGEQDQNFENWITQNHTAPQTTSDIQYRGALKGASHSFFSGLVYIGKEAQQSDAYQGAKSLLLSNEARADAIPNLEILADDVKCSHGAAVGPVDEDTKYYMQTRGVSPALAEEIIVQGFFEPVISAVPSEPVQEQLRNFVEEKLHR